MLDELTLLRHENILLLKKVELLEYKVSVTGANENTFYRMQGELYLQDGKITSLKEEIKRLTPTTTREGPR